MRSAHYLGLCLVVAMIGATAGCAHPVMTDALPVAPEALTDTGLQVQWHTDVTLPDDPSLKNIWLCDPYLVFCDRQNRIYTINAATGIRLYTQVVAEPYQKVWAPAVAKDTLWVPTTTTLWGFAGPDGVDVGRRKIEFSPSGGAATNGSVVFIPETRGWLQAVAVSKEYVQWAYWAGGKTTASGVLSDDVTEVDRELGDVTANDVNARGKEAKGWKGLNWGRWTDGTMTARPICDGTQVYFAGQDGIVYASQQNIRRVNWEYKTSGPIVADLGRTKSGLILAASLDYTLYALGQGGREAWKYHSGEPLTNKPYSTGKDVFLITPEAGLTTLDVAGGRVRWTQADASAFLSSDADNVYVLSRTRNLLVLNRTDGKVKSSVPMARKVLFTVNESDNGVIYLCSPGGQLEAIGRKGAPATTPLPTGGKPIPGPEPKVTPAAATAAAM
jgi:hypothetical protein